VPTHFSTLGLPVESEEQFVDLAQQAAQDCELYESPHGRYLRGETACGAELWLQLDDDDNLLGMNPYFAGKSRVRVALTARLTRPDGTPLDGAFHAWADPSDDNSEMGAYPFVFDAPDFHIYDDVELPAVCDASVAAFAHEVELFDNPEVYEASQETEPKFAAQSFIPSGLFTAEGAPAEPPLATALFSGIIREAEMRTNELSNKSFHWLLVETLGGVYDVVIDPELLAGEPRIGGVISGAFWLTGRLLGEDEASEEEDETAA
jgi:hypothetical protein